MCSAPLRARLTLCVGLALEHQPHHTTSKFNFLRSCFIVGSNRHRALWYWFDSLTIFVQSKSIANSQAIGSPLATLFCLLNISTMVKLLSPIITLSSIAAASAGNLRSSKGRELVTQLFDTEDVNPNPPAVENFKETRIIGGDDADKGEYGYIVSLEDKWGHFCGGTLIAPDIVMSAAHCSGGPMSVRVGAHDISRDEGKVIKVTKQVTHNQYKPDTTDYDFMILKLQEPVPAGTPIAKLHDRDDLRDGDSVHVIGWGNMNANGFEPAKVLQHVEVKYIPNDECNQAYGGEITNAMLCAGEDNGGEDACQGDSGGPLVRKDGNGHTLVGVVSWGYGVSNFLL